MDDNAHAAVAVRSMGRCMELGPHQRWSVLEHLEARTFLSRGVASVDLMIRNYGDADYVGAGVVNNNAAGQVMRQGQPFFPSIFQVQVTNNGTGADRFLITGPASRTASWRIWYYDSQVQGGHAGGGQYTTNQVTGKGWMTPVIGPGASYAFRFEVGASPLAAAGAKEGVLLKAASVSDPSKSDVVEGVAYNLPRDEVEVRRRNYAIVSSESGTYLLDLQNYGNRTDRYVVTASGNGAGYA